MSSVMMCMTATTQMLRAPLRGPIESQLEQLKDQLLHPILERISDSELVRELAWTANEAAALAWFTVCPILVLPGLLEEKIRETLTKWEKQKGLRRRTGQTPEPAFQK